MAKPSLSHELDRIVQAILDAPRAAPGVDAKPAAPADAKVASLLHIAADLRDLPREEFKVYLQEDLKRRASMASKPAAAQQDLQTATPYLCIAHAAAAIEFYKQAFGATETMRFNQPDGRIGHAEIRIGNASIMLADEFPDFGFLAPQSLGGSPVKLHLYVSDVDALSAQAVAAGARIVRPIADQFYGERSGQVADPFGYTWILSTRKEVLSQEEMEKRLAAFNQQQEEANKAKQERAGKVSPIPAGHRTITPYLVAPDAARIIDFVKQTFAAEEAFRAIGSAGGIHCEVRLGNSVLMIGGGGPGLPWSGKPNLAALHVYVPSVDAAYERALKAGATSLQEPADQFYGERNASVKDAAGNHWYIAYPTYLGEKYDPEKVQTVQAYLHPRRGEPVINFLKKAFGAEEFGRHASPEGVIHHTTLKIGDSTLELGEADGPYQPLPSMFYLHVDNVDALYSRALGAGAISEAPPADQPYGARVAAVKDAFGYTWYMATQIKDAAQ